MNPTITVIIPVRNDAAHLQRALEALRGSTVPPLEVIVVDDASSDNSAEIAERHGARVFRNARQSGPARARNLGARMARGEVLLFLDADVCVYPNTLERISAQFAQDPTLDALIGAYDAEPEAPDFLSQYRNLMHCFVHHHARHEASTFWSGCGAIRRHVFLEVGGFDECYRRPSVEDIELGYRLRQRGRKIVLDPTIEVKHLKRWTFWELVRTDIFDRGIPWTELILRDRHMPNDLNLQVSQRISVALAFLIGGLSLAGAIYWRGYFLVPMFAALFLVMGRYWVEHASSRERRAGLVWTAMVTGALMVAAWWHGMDALVPLLGLGYALLVIRHRYELGARGWRYTSAVILLVLVALGIFVLFYVPYHYFVFSLALALLSIVLLNSQFYVFLAVRKGRAFALAAIPFHLLFHFYNGISFIAGTLRYAWKGLVGQRSVEPRRPSLLDEEVPYEHRIDTRGIEASDGVARRAH